MMLILNGGDRPITIDGILLDEIDGHFEDTISGHSPCLSLVVDFLWLPIFGDLGDEKNTPLLSDWIDVVLQSEKSINLPLTGADVFVTITIQFDPSEACRFVYRIQSV